MSISKLSTNGLTGSKYDTVSADNYYMEPIATTLVGAGGTASVTFSNIPNTYKHLQIRILSRSDRSAASQDGIRIQYNSDSGAANYVNYHVLYGDGSSAAAAAVASGVTPYNSIGTMSASSATSGMFGVTIVDILDYANVYKFKTVRSLYGTDQNGSGQIGLVSGLWMNTAAVNQVVVTQNNGNIVQHSRFSLYGIRG
jgi:hypothetical protein